MSGPRVPRLIVIPDPRFSMGRAPSERGTGPCSSCGAETGRAPPEDTSVPLGIVERLAAAALAGGADAIQLRAKWLGGPLLVELGRRLAARCSAAGALFFVNDSATVARDCGADGVHVGPGDSAPSAARRLLGDGALLGVSVYGPGDLAAAAAARADYVAVGAVYPTTTKEIAVVGLAGVRRWRAATRLPVVAIGGIDAGNAAAAIAAGADGVAVIAAVCAAADPEAAARELRAAVDAALAARA